MTDRAAAGLEELRALSEAATPGPWCDDSYGPDDRLGFGTIFAAERWRDDLPDSAWLYDVRAATAADSAFAVAAVNYVRAALSNTDDGAAERDTERPALFTGQMTWPCLCGHPKGDHYFGDALDSSGQMHTPCQQRDGCHDFHPAAAAPGDAERLHRPISDKLALDDDEWCAQDGEPWPCPFIRSVYAGDAERLRDRGRWVPILALPHEHEHKCWSPGSGTHYHGHSHSHPVEHIHEHEHPTDTMVADRLARRPRCRSRG